MHRRHTVRTPTMHGRSIAPRHHRRMATLYRQDHMCMVALHRQDSTHHVHTPSIWVSKVRVLTFLMGCNTCSGVEGTQSERKRLHFDVWRSGCLLC